MKTNANQSAHNDPANFARTLNQLYQLNQLYEYMTMPKPLGLSDSHSQPFYSHRQPQSLGLHAGSLPPPREADIGNLTMATALSSQNGGTQNFDPRSLHLPLARAEEARPQVFTPPPPIATLTGRSQGRHTAGDIRIEEPQKSSF